MAAKKESKYRDAPQMTGWRLNVQKFAKWSLLPLGYGCAAPPMLTRPTRYYLVFHYGELYNENMPFENVLATPRRLHDDFFRSLLGKQTIAKVEKPEPMGLRAMLDAQEKREKAQSFLANRQSQALLSLVQRIEEKGLNRVREERGLTVIPKKA